MTITANDRRKNYKGNGVATDFSGPRVFSDQHVVVYFGTGEGESDEVSRSLYSVKGAGGSRSSTIEFNTPPADGTEILILRTVPFDQPTNITNQGAFLPELHEDSFDYRAMQVQQLDDRQLLSVRISETYPGEVPDLLLPPPEAGKGIGWNYDKSGLRNITLTGAGDLTLRDDLADPAAGAILVSAEQEYPGAVNRSVKDKINTELTVNDFGAVADGATNGRNALLSYNSVVGNAVVKFETTHGGVGTYLFDGTQDTDFADKEIDVPDRATISLDSSDYGRLKAARFTRQTRLHFRDIDVDYFPDGKQLEQRNKSQFIGRGDLRMQKLSPVSPNLALRFLSIPSSSSDTFSADSPTFADGRSYSYSGKGTGQWYGGFIALRRGETYTVAVSQTPSAGAAGIMFRHVGGYSVLFADASNPASAQMWRQIKATGQTVQTAQDVTFPGRGEYQSYDPSRAVWGVTILDNGKALVTLNGRAVTQPVWSTSLGDIVEVGYVWQPTAGGASCSFSDAMIERNTDPLGRAALAEIRIFGDSTSDYIAGMWQDDLKDMLDHTFGMKLEAISNFAVSATNTLDVLDSITANGLGNAYYVVVGIGTNDIQSGADLAVSGNNMAAIISAITTAGRVPVIVLPYMWYGKAQVGSSRGQDAARYDQGAAYRARFARLCADQGAVLVDPTRELPEPKPSYVTDDTVQDPLVRDNIHQSYLGYKLYAWAIARAIASHASLLTNFKDYRQAIPAEWMRNGYSAGANLKVQITENGLVTIQGNVSVGTGANNVVIMNLPRWARPEMDQVFPVLTNASPAPMGQITVGAGGDVTINGVGSAFTVVHLGGAGFYAAEG